MVTNSRIGFIGLGQMGGGMAENLLKAGFPITGYDIKPKATDRFTGRKFEMAASVSDVVEACDQIHTCLWGDVFYKVAEDELLSAAKTGQVFIDHSTLSPPRIRQYAKRFAQKGAILLDAPVSGGATGSNAGTLAMFVGGDEKIFERVKDILLVMADSSKLFYGGESGKGQVLKIIQQLKERILTLGRLEVLAFGVNEGVPMEEILSVLGEDPNGDGAYAKTARDVADGNTFSLSCMFAEWKYYLEESEERGIPLPIISAVNEFYKKGDLTTKDNVGRSCPWLWHELTGEKLTQRRE